MRSREKIRKFFRLIKKLLRILWIVIFIHWIFWATTYARAPHYYRAIDPKKNEELTQHDGKTSRYKDNAEGWLGKLVENKPAEATIGDIEEDILSQIEAQSEQKNLPREWTKHLLELENLTKKIRELEKKSSRSESEQKELDQKRQDYQKKLKESRKKTTDNIQKQLKENNLNITELNDRRGLGARLFIDPFKFFLISPLNRACKVFRILGRPETSFFLTEVIFKIVVVKLLFLWISYPESIGLKIQENIQKAQNPQLSLEEREQSQQEANSLAKYQLFNMTTFLLPWFVFLHPAHLDKAQGPFLNSVPLPYLLIPLLIIPYLFSMLTHEPLRQGGKRLRSKEIKNFFAQSWFMFVFIFIMMAAWAAQNQGNYWWVLLGFGIDILFNLVRLRILRYKTTPPSSGTFKVWRVKGPPSS